MPRVVSARDVLLGLSLPARCRTMVTQLIQHERIETTFPKAKELQKMADKCITLAKKVSLPAELFVQGIGCVVARPQIQMPQA